MSDQTVILMIGLAFNFVAMLIGGFALLFSGGRWLSQIVERLAAVEVSVKYLMVSRERDEARRASNSDARKRRAPRPQAMARNHQSS